MYTVVVIATKPYAQSVTRTFRDEPEHREVEAFMEECGADSAKVIPPVRS